MKLKKARRNNQMLSKKAASTLHRGCFLKKEEDPIRRLGLRRRGFGSVGLVGADLEPAGNVSGGDDLGA